MPPVCFNFFKCLMYSQLELKDIRMGCSTSRATHSEWMCKVGFGGMGTTMGAGRVSFDIREFT